MKTLWKHIIWFTFILFYILIKKKITIILYYILYIGCKIHIKLYPKWKHFQRRKNER
jgi:hypothetical protein